MGRVSKEHRHVQQSIATIGNVPGFVENGEAVAAICESNGEPRLGRPALDGLFGRGVIPDLETTRLANRNLMEAIYRLAWLKKDAGLVPVNWRDMEKDAGSMSCYYTSWQQCMTTQGIGGNCIESPYYHAQPTQLPPRALVKPRHHRHFRTVRVRE